MWNTSGTTFHFASSVLEGLDWLHQKLADLIFLSTSI